MGEPIKAETLTELREAIAEHRKQLRACDTQKTAVAWMARAHELMGFCMDRLAGADKVPLIIQPQRPQLVVASSMREAARVVGGPDGQPKWFDPRVKTVVYPVRPDPQPGSMLAPKAWTHADTLRLERVIRDKPNTAKLKKWAERKVAR